MDVVVGVLRFNFAPKRIVIPFAFQDLPLGVTQFEVRFSVEVLGLDIAGTFGVTGVDQDDVRWEWLVSLDFYHRTDRNGAPRVLFAIYLRLPSILFFVALIALEVLVSIFDHTDDDDNEQEG